MIAYAIASEEVERETWTAVLSDGNEIASHREHLLWSTVARHLERTYREGVGCTVVSITREIPASSVDLIAQYTHAGMVIHGAQSVTPDQILARYDDSEGDDQ